MTPENMKRPAYLIETSKGASDLAGSMAAALASTAIVWRDYGNDSAYADTLMQGARTLYGQATKYQGAYTANYKCAPLSTWATTEVSLLSLLYFAQGLIDYGLCFS